MPINLPKSEKAKQNVRAPTTKQRVQMSVSDGGLYDNLGLQPVDRIGTVLVSDGGAPFVAAVPRGVLGRGKAYLAVSGKQAGALRKRYLIAQYQDERRKGAYWGINSAVSRYQKAAGDGYSKDLSEGVISRIRTDLDAFSKAEMKVLVNHGYTLADIAIKTHASDLMRTSTAGQVPFEDWMNEAKVRSALAQSHKRKVLGRFS